MRSLSTNRPARFILASAALAALVSCSDEKSNRGIELMPDMYHSPAYRQQAAMVVPKERSADGKEHHVPALLPPVAGTVARDFTPYQIAAADLESARQLVNPLAPTTDVLVQGQHGFNIYCATCHGRDGNSANGYVAKHFAGVPSINGPNVASFSDGELYHIVTMGRGRMPAYAAQLLPQQRWAVVHYLRALDRATLATADVEKLVQDAELALRENPKDANKKAQLETDRTLLEQRRRDLAAIQQVGEHGGDGFAPLPDPRPEYLVPTWPDADAPQRQEAGK
jgi:mono/diheme cytochrome c family protein